MGFLRAAVSAVSTLVFIVGCNGGGSPPNPGGGGISDGGAGGADDASSSDAGSSSEDATPDVTRAEQDPPNGQLGEPCAKGSDCASGICLDIGRCTSTCSDAADCPVSPNWQCGLLPGVGKICQCQPTGPAEECDSKDNDCNGFIDDGKPCPESGQACEYGQCVCPPENDCAYGGCRDLQSDPQHCGECYNACPTTCTAGKCDCPVGETACYDIYAGETLCVDVQNDGAHCGGCGAECGDAEVCKAGACQCYGVDGSKCAGECRDLDVAPLNCGDCSVQCPAGPGGAAPMCAAGQCTYAETVTEIGPTPGYFVDLAVDAANVYVAESEALWSWSKGVNALANSKLPAGCVIAAGGGVAVDSDAVYRLVLCNQDSYRVNRYERAHLYESTPPVGWTSTLSQGAAVAVGGIAAAGSNVYYVIGSAGSGNYQVLSVPKSGGASAASVYDSPVRLSGLAADATHLYVVESVLYGPTLRVLRIPHNGGTSTEVVHDDAWYANWTPEGGLDVAGDDVFYLAGWITRKVSVGGGQPSTVIGDWDVTKAIGADATHVYWVASHANGVGDGLLLKRTPR